MNILPDHGAMQKPGRCGLVREHMFSMHQVLGSIPSTSKTTKKTEVDCEFHSSLTHCHAVPELSETLPCVYLDSITTRQLHCKSPSELWPLSVSPDLTQAFAFTEHDKSGITWSVS